MVSPQWWQAVRQAVGMARRLRRHMRRWRPGVEVLEGRLAPTVTLSISNPVPFPKPDTGQLFGMFVVTRSGDLTSEVLVDYATQDGSGANGAHAGTDYVAETGTLIFAPYQITAAITVVILGNNVFQADKTFTVSLSHPVPGLVFGPQQTFATGSHPASAAVGDFNGDGKPDLVVANGGTFQNPGATVSVLLNTTLAGATTPAFAPQQTFTTGSYPRSVAVGDFNGDGKPDLAVASSSGVSVLLNTTPVGATAPSFAPQQTFATGSFAESVAVGDFNGDGKPDLAITNNYGPYIGSVAVLLNTTPAGATVPSFAPRQTFVVGTGTWSVAVGDFNGDGKPDLAVTNLGSYRAASTLSVLLNTTPAGATAPSFAPQQTFPIYPDSVSIAVGDFNGDSKPDLAIASENPNGAVSVLLNTTPTGATTPSFGYGQTFATNGAIYSVAVADFNGDGKPDLAVGNLRYSAILILLNTTSPGATTPSFAPRRTFFDNGGAPYAIAAGDFNADGKPALALASYQNTYSSKVSVLFNESPAITLIPSFAPQQTFATDSGPDWVAVEDFNGDGKPDLAISNQFSNTVSVLLNTTPSGVTAPTFAPQQTFATGRNPDSVVVGDFNGDGKPDLAVANFLAGTVSVLLNTTPTEATTPSFAPQQTFGVGTYPNSVAVGDFNGDGKPDLVVPNERSGMVSVLLNTTPAGATTPSFAPRLTFAAGAVAYSVTVGDFNGDGKPDFAVVNLEGSVSVLLNTTPAGATAPSFAPQLTFATGIRPYLVAVGDFNDDGKPDLAVANDGSGTVSVLLNTTPAGATAPSFAPQLTFATGNGPSSVAVGDFTGDGKPDLAVTNWGFGTVSVLLDTTMAGATTPSFALPQVFTTGTDPSSLAVGDFNSDGKPDLAVTNFVGNTVSVLINSLRVVLTGSLATGTISSAQEAPTAVAVVAGTTPQSAFINAVFAVPLAVDVRDAAGHLVQGVSVTFTAPASGPSGRFGNSISVTVLTNASGRATAPAFVANTIAGSYMVTAQAAGGSNPITSFSLTNTPAAASSFTLTGLPANLIAGTPGTLTVTAHDPFNNVATGYTGTVHFSSTDPNAALPDDYTFTANDHGVHTFAGLVLQTAGIRYVIAADTADPRIDGVSPGVRVVAATADHFAITTSSADPDVAGTPFDVTVTVQDVYGNTVTDYAGTVTFSSGDPYGASLPPDYTFQPSDQGTVIFSGGATLYTAGTWDVTATDTTSGITGSAFVNVIAASASAFQVLAPATVAPGTPFDVTVLAVDAYGNTDTNYQGTITFSTSDPDPGVVLPPDYTFRPSDQGTVTFASGVTLMTPGDQTLTATDPDSGIMGTTSVTVSGPGDGALARWRPEMRRWAAIGDAAFDALLVTRKPTLPALPPDFWNHPSGGVCVYLLARKREVLVL